MANFCSKCNAQLDEGTKVCPNCGTDLSQTNQPSKKNNSKIIIEVIAVVIAAVIAVAGYFILSGSKGDSTKEAKKNKEESSFVENKNEDKPDNKNDSTSSDKTENTNSPNIDKKPSDSDTKQNADTSSDYEAIIDAFMRAIEDGNIDNLVNVLPGKFTEDEKDFIISNLKNDFKMIKEGYEESVGKNYKITYKVVDEEKANDSQLKIVKKNLGYDGPNYGDITEAVKVNLEITLKGPKNKFDTETELELIKEDGKWKMVF